MKILVLDDSVVIRTAVRKCLEDEKFITSIITTSKGENALSLIQKTHFDLFLVDLEMPDMSGEAVIAQVRVLNQKIKILVFSSLAHKGSERAIKALAAGANDFLLKPESAQDDIIIEFKKVIIPKVITLVNSEGNKKLRLENTLPKNLQNFRPKAVFIGFTEEYLPYIPEVLASVTMLKFPVFIFHPELDDLSNNIKREFYKISLIDVKEGIDNLKDVFYITPNGKRFSFLKGTVEFAPLAANLDIQDLFREIILGALEVFKKDLLFINLSSDFSEVLKGFSRLGEKSSFIFVPRETADQNVIGIDPSSISFYLNLFSDVNSYEVNPATEVINPLESNDIFDFITKITSNDISDKKTQIISTIVSRMKIKGIQSREKYFNLVKENREEQNILISKVTNHSTKWFRHIDHFNFLKNHIEKLLKETNKKLINVLCLGCSSGEEVYSISLMLNHMFQNYPGTYYSVKGHDIDELCINKAKKGTYDLWSFKQIPKDYHNYLTVRTKDFELSKEIMKNCHFEKKNIQREFIPDTIYDVIFCRYILIYFDDKNVKNILSKVYDSLSARGVLFVGEKEIIPIKEFKREDKGIYKKVPR